MASSAPARWESFDSLNAARDSIRANETLENVKYILSKRVKNPAEQDVPLGSRNFMFCETRSKVPISFDGVPFAILGGETWECHQGPERRKSRKTSNADDHTYSTKRKRVVQCTKKVGCKVQFTLKTILKFPLFKAEANTTKHQRFQILRRLREAVAARETQRELCVLLLRTGEHEGHALGEEARFGVPLDKRIISEIRNLVHRGIKNTDAVRVQLQSFTRTLPDSNTSHRFVPTTRDIRNHINKALKVSRTHQDGQHDLLVSVDNWRQSYESDRFHYQPAQIDEQGNISRFLLVHQTAFQQHLLQKYGKGIVLMDATYKTCRFDVPLFFIGVLTNVGYSVVASFVLGQEQTVQITSALQVLRSWNPGLKPKGFMCDLDIKEINAVGAVFPECPVFTCAFHREQSWNRWLKKGSNNCTKEKESVLSDLRRIADSQTEEEMTAHIEVLKSKPAYQQNPKFRNWMNNTWLNHKKRWVRCFRNELSQVFVNTTNGLEAFNRVFKHKYLNKTGPSQRLTEMVRLLVENFLPDLQEAYLHQNTMAASTSRRYSPEVPPFLHDRPRPFVNHCMDRIDQVPEGNVEVVNGVYHVQGSIVELDVPSCSCRDFQKTNWPCPHVLAVIKVHEDGWESLPLEYRDQPVFNLDSGAPSSTTTVSSEPSGCHATVSRLTIQKQILSSLEDIKSSIYLVTNQELVLEVDEQLKTMVAQLQSSTPNLVTLPIKKTKKKKGQRQHVSTTAKKTKTSRTKVEQAVPVAPVSVNLPEDEIGKALDGIWRGTPGDEPVVQIGPYLLTTESFHYIRENLSDEVIDASLLMLAESSSQPAYHVNCAVWTSVFSNEDRSVHSMLPRMKLLDYDFVFGAINENGLHWSLVVVKPKERKVLYLNPLGEPEDLQGCILHNWYKFLHARYTNGLDDSRPEGWELLVPPHARQRDSTSCGVYSIQFAENLLQGVPLQFSWSRIQVHGKQCEIARRLLAEGEPRRSSPKQTQMTNQVNIETESHELGLSASDVTIGQSNDSVNTESQLGNHTSASPVTPLKSNEDVNLERETNPNTPASPVSIPEHSPPPSPVFGKKRKNVAAGFQFDLRENPKKVNLERETNPNTPASPVSIPEHAGCQFDLRENPKKKTRNSFLYEPVKKKTRTYCICRKPNDGKLYWKCDMCEEWFHPECLGLSATEEPENFICSGCQTIEVESGNDEAEEVDDNEIEEDDNDQIEGECLFNRNVIDILIDVAYRRVQDIIDFKNPRATWMRSHYAFRAGGESAFRGFGFSWFTQQGLIHLQKKLMDKYFYGNTRGTAYFIFGEIPQMQDNEMRKHFDKQPHRAKRYIELVAAREAMVALLQYVTKEKYQRCVDLMKETEHPFSFMVPLKRGTDMGPQNKKRWQTALTNILENYNYMSF